MTTVTAVGARSRVPALVVALVSALFLSTVVESAEVDTGSAAAGAGSGSEGGIGFGFDVTDFFNEKDALVYWNDVMADIESDRRRGNVNGNGNGNGDNGHANVEYCTQISDLMERGWWKLAGSVVETCKMSKKGAKKISSEVYGAVSAIQRQLNTMKQLLSVAAKPINPSFRWAQSPDRVFVLVKFAHKWDTPATLGVKSENVSITHDRFLFKGHSKSARKRFELNLPLNKEIVPENSSWSFSSVGRASIVLAKSSNVSWSKLLRKGAKMPKNSHMWFEMQEKYEGAMKDLAKSMREKAQRISEEKEKGKDNPSDESSPQADSSTDSAQATSDNDNSEGATPPENPESATSEASAAADPVEEDAITREIVRVEKEGRIARRKALKEHKAELVKIDSWARGEKRTADETASARKKQVEQEARDKRKAAEDSKEKLIMELKVKHEFNLAETRAKFGVKPEL